MREVERGILPDPLAEHGDVAFARFELPGDQLHERRFAGAVGAEQPGDAGGHGQRDVVQADDLAVPLRQMRCRDDRRAGLAHAITSTPRTRRSRMRPDAATSSDQHPDSDTGQGVS